MAEWLKAHDSKSCGPKGLGGSNPLASAIDVGTEKKILWSFFKLKIRIMEILIFYSLPLPVKTAATVLMRILIS